MSIAHFFAKKRPLSNAQEPPKKRKRRSIPAYIATGEEEEIVYIEYCDAHGLEELLNGLHELGCENDQDEERYIFPLQDFKSLLRKCAHSIFTKFKFQLKEPAAVGSAPCGITFNLQSQDSSTKPENFKSLADGEKLRYLLRKIWKFDQFRGNQEEAMLSFYKGEDVFLMLPTGGGKSLCYLIPMLARSGIGVVICPLISLMFDQVRDLQKLGVQAYFWNSTLTKEQLSKLKNNLQNGKVKILYISPERFHSNSFLDILPKLNVQTIACDECHCISQYGRSFRPAYFRLGRNLAEWLPSVPILACTASAPQTVQEDVVKILFSGRSRPPVRISKSVLRSNIHLQIRNAPEITELKKEEKMGTKLEYILKDLSQNGKNIIYATTVDCCKEVETIFKSRERIGNSWPHITESYYSNLPKKQKEKVQNDFVDGSTNVVAATSAFGMGIDVSNVRAVIHTLNPNSVEEYYQNIGRAGRDGKPSQAICVRNEDEDDWWLQMAERSVASFEQVQKFFNWLKVQKESKIEMSGKELNKAIFDGKAHDMNISRIKTYLKGAGVISIQKEHPYVMTRKLQCFRKKLRVGKKRTVWNYIQRKCHMRREYKLYAYKISLETGVAKQKVNDAMRDLKEKKAIDFTKQKVHTIWIRDRNADISYLKEKIEADREYKKQQVESMREFLRLDGGCRWRWLRRYFGEEVPEAWRCDNCDLCER